MVQVDESVGFEHRQFGELRESVGFDKVVSQNGFYRFQGARINEIEPGV